MTSSLRARRGAVAIMTALLAIPLVAMTGLAIDLSRVWLVRARLQSSLDAAVLVAARDISTGGTSSDGVNMFWTNFNRTSKVTNAGYLGATATPPVVHNPAPGDVAGSVQMTSTATVTPTLLGVLNIGVVTVGAAATAKTAATGLELAMVLDNTGSMAGSSISALIDASKTLLDILYGTTSDTQPHLWVSVVPFGAVLNVGKTHTNWLASGSLDQSKYAPSSWMGCVMARAKPGVQYGDDFNDKTPSQAPLTPFLYQSTWHVYPKTGPIQYRTGTGTKQDPYVYHNFWYPGDNEWTVSPNNIVEPDSGNTAVGPNLDCPSLPILPETASKATVLSVINKMAPVYRGGTFINLGLQAGWWTLSPNWKGLWGDPTMPLAYNTPYMRKAIILMTDGNNEWYDWDVGVPGQKPPPASPICVAPAAPPTCVPAWTADGDADFTAYGRLKSNTLGINASQASITTTLNTWMSQMCTTLKQNGIVIYTVLFNNTTPATVALFTNCASSPADYFQSPSVVPLKQAFQQIGQDLSSLRLSQ